MTSTMHRDRPNEEGVIPSSTTSSDSLADISKTRVSPWRKFLNTINYQPPWTRWDPENPPVFSMPMNILFGFAGAFTVANLYYSHPILNILADEFGVSYEKVSQIPTLAQSGYAVGLLFLCPCGDIFMRRPFVLSLVFFTATLWYDHLGRSTHGTYSQPTGLAYALQAVSKCSARYPL